MQETVLQKIPAALNDGTKIKVSRGHSVTRVLKMGVNGAAHSRHVFLGSPPGPIHSKILKIIISKQTPRANTLLLRTTHYLYNTQSLLILK